MNIEDINTEFHNNNLRCEKIYPLFAFPDASMDGHELIEEIIGYDESLNKALGLTDEFFDELDKLERWQKPDEIACVLYYEGKLNGYLAKFAKPVATKFYESGFNFSWGYYTTTWLYAETLEDLFNKSFEWAKECHEHDLEEWKKEGKSQ